MSRKGKPQLPKTPSEPAGQAERPGGGEAAKEHIRRLVAEGARLLAARRPGEAADRLGEAWQLDPGNAAAAINLGGAYILQGRHDRAVPVLEAASQLEPENALVWSNLAAAYLGKLLFATAQRQDKAIEAYERALTLDPRAPHVHYNLGLIHMERKDTQRAVAHFYGALETDPADRDAQYWLDQIESGNDQPGQIQSPD